MLITQGIVIVFQAGGVQAGVHLVGLGNLIFNLIK